MANTESEAALEALLGAADCQPQPQPQPAETADHQNNTSLSFLSAPDGGSDSDDEFFDARSVLSADNQEGNSDGLQERQLGDGCSCPPESLISYGDDSSRHSKSIDLESHRLVFEGRIEELTVLLDENSEELSKKDPHGNTILHVAVIRGDKAIATRLMALGARVETKNDRGWSCMDHAVSLGNRSLVKMMYMHRMAEIKSDVKAKKKEVAESLKHMPNYRMKISWKLGSNVLGLLLKKYAPHDVYDVWKLGNRIRVDGTLMGVEEESKGVIPEWKRGQFSLLFQSAENYGADKSRVVLVNHKTQQWVDLSKQKKNAGDTTDMEVSMLMRDGAGKTKMKTSELRFKPVKTWLGNHTKETVEGWSTTVYEAQARLVAISTYKTPMRLPTGCSFEEYLRLELPKDRVNKRPVDPLSMDMLKKGGKVKGPVGGESSEADDAKAKPARKITSRCWMAEDFPLSLKDLLPIMDIIGTANKHFTKISGFMRKYGEKDLFPVKIQVPLLMTVFAMVAFRGFEKLHEQDAGLDPSFYEVPPSFQEVSTEEMFGAKKRRQQAKPSKATAVAVDSENDHHFKELGEWEEDVDL